ncbi:MAG: HAD family hydrolase [Eggerthellaceae bacterium]|nr:HAD family hydrolase [Eggerthellaceae bacterium]
MDIDEFMSAYFQRIARFMQERGMDGRAFMTALKGGTKEMAAHSDDRTNEEAFWDEFFPVYEAQTGQALTETDRQQMRALADEFYDKDFPLIGESFQANPDSARVINALHEKGYPLVLATMPMFPRRAVEHRLEWAGVKPDAFARITSYENSKAVKPKQIYFAEQLAAIGEPGSRVLMVGNNTMEDLACLDVGFDGYLIMDWLLDPVSFDVDTVKHSSMAEFADWVEALPACTSPAPSIMSGAVPEELTQEALKTNAVRSIDLKEAERKAALVANAVTGKHAKGDAASLRVD